MDQRISRRTLAKAAAVATLGLTSAEAAGAAGSPQPGSPTRPPSEGGVLDVRPYQLMCIICRIGRGQTQDLGDARLTEILAAVREDPAVPVRLRCSADSVFRYQNPGPADDSPEGDLFNAKRDLDVLQKLGRVPGDTRPGVDLFERILAKIPAANGICGYETVTADAWRGCPRAASGDYERGHALGIGAIIPPRDKQEKADFKKASVAAIYQAETLRIRPHHLMCMSCFYGARIDKLAPIQEDNLFEAIDAIQKNPDIPVTLIRGTCMICPPCSRYDPETRQCLGGKSMALRDQKKDLDVLQKLGLEYGDTLPARKLYELLYERIPSTRDVCGYGTGEETTFEWRICGDPEGQQSYLKARAAMLGLLGSPQPR